MYIQYGMETCVQKNDAQCLLRRKILFLLSLYNWHSLFNMPYILEAAWSDQRNPSPCQSFIGVLKVVSNPWPIDHSGDPCKASLLENCARGCTAGCVLVVAGGDRGWTTVSRTDQRSGQAAGSPGQTWRGNCSRLEGSGSAVQIGPAPTGKRPAKCHWHLTAAMIKVSSSRERVHAVWGQVSVTKAATLAALRAPSPPRWRQQQ